MFLCFLNKVDLSWKNGWTEQKARQQCIDAFQASSSFSVCDTHVRSVPSEDYIKKCIADIRVIFVHIVKAYVL